MNEQALWIISVSSLMANIANRCQIWLTRRNQLKIKDLEIDKDEWVPIDTTQRDAINNPTGKIKVYIDNCKRTLDKAEPILQPVYLEDATKENRKASLDAIVTTPQPNNLLVRSVNY